MGIIELVEWRDSIKDKQKAKKIQRVINRKFEYLKRIQYPFWIMLYKFDIYGTRWRMENQ